MNQPHPSGLTCNHAEVGLCPKCSEDYDTDPGAWIEFGPHPAGQANWHRLQEEMADDYAAEECYERMQAAQDKTPPNVYDEIPF